jgi:glycosyltransferase involved in cell wall biosynthesis
LFLQTVINLNQKYSANNIKFLWVGYRSEEFISQFEYEVKRINQAQLGEKVIFIDSVPQPQDYFQLFDIFLLSSREDPFPLVMLENAALGKPVFCFDQSGGSTEFVGDDAGVIVPYADTNAMADAIFNYLQVPDKLKAMGQAGLSKVQRYDVEKGAGHILEIIQQAI